ncbi:MAG: hypothetical protein U5N55_04770 [Cypionkella sp.]|nr:hypothetical protein [Cypionkella sp.]
MNEQTVMTIAEAQMVQIVDPMVAMIERIAMSLQVFCPWQRLTDA